MLINNNEKLSAALHTLGIPNLHPWQEAPISAILQGDDVFVTAPTGGGKSLLYQLPAVMEARHALTIVISPLRSLQRDQVIQLQQKGINAVLLNSDLTKLERRTVLDELPHTNLLYLAPEQLRSKDLLEALSYCRVARVAVDEAHVLPQAMLGFRKAYNRIDQFLFGLPERPQVIACTATATKEMRKRICKALGIFGAKMFALPVRRTNLFLKEALIK